MKSATKQIKDRHSLSNGQGQGMNWLRPEKRLAIYLRDGLACAYCGDSVENGVKLTLDHLTPHSKGGSNDATNLVTCCFRCNSVRGNRAWRKFAEHVAAYLNPAAAASEITSFIAKTRTRVLNVTAAKELIAARGSFTAALYTKEM